MTEDSRINYRIQDIKNCDSCIHSYLHHEDLFCKESGRWNHSEYIWESLKQVHPNGICGLYIHEKRAKLSILAISIIHRNSLDGEIRLE